MSDKKKKKIYLGCYCIHMTKVTIESPSFVETTQGDICGIIHLQLIWVIKVFCGFIEVSTRWSHVCVISIINVSFFLL